MKFRVSLYVISGMAIALLWYSFLIAPAHRRQAQLAADIEAAQIQLEDFQATLNQLPIFLQTRDGLNRKIDEINARLYSRQEMLDLFDHVESLAKQHGLFVYELAPRIEELLLLAQSKPKPGEPQSLGIALRLTGDYLAFGQFIEQLESEAFFKAVDKCLISDSPDLSGRLLFDLHFMALLETAMRQV